MLGVDLYEYCQDCVCPLTTPVDTVMMDGKLAPGMLSPGCMHSVPGPGSCALYVSLVGFGAWIRSGDSGVRSTIKPAVAC